MNISAITIILMMPLVFAVRAVSWWRNYFSCEELLGGVVISRTS